MHRGTDEKVEMLSALTLFEGCSHHQLQEVARLTETFDVAAGAVLVREGGLAAEFFGIVEGCAMVTRRGHTVARLGRGEYFGEVGVLSRMPRDAQVSAETPMRLVVVERRALVGLLQRLPSLNRELMRGLARRLHYSDLAEPQPIPGAVDTHTG
jgi:CRP-like cAMP-binding protein